MIGQYLAGNQRTRHLWQLHGQHAPWLRTTCDGWRFFVCFPDKYLWCDVSQNWHSLRVSRTGIFEKFQFHCFCFQLGIHGCKLLTVMRISKKSVEVEMLTIRSAFACHRFGKCRSHCETPTDCWDAGPMMCWGDRDERKTKRRPLTQLTLRLDDIGILHFSIFGPFFEINCIHVFCITRKVRVFWDLRSCCQPLCVRTLKGVLLPWDSWICSDRLLNWRHVDASLFNPS